MFRVIDGVVCCVVFACRAGGWSTVQCPGSNSTGRVAGPVTPIMDGHVAGPVRCRLGMRWAITVSAWASSSRARCEPKQ
jgi:hypothetical protein